MTLAPAPRSPFLSVRLLIADDRSRTRRALRALLAAHAGFEVVGKASDGEEALAREEALAAGADAFVPNGGRPDELRVGAVRP